MGNSLGLRVFQGAVGTVENLGLVFHRFHGPVFSTALGLWLPDWLTIRRIAANHVWAETDGHGLIQMLVNDYGASGQGMSEPAFL